ncbi:MAG: hypothetical protein A2Y60_04475 [Chloroflexi bacterium RBG_13_54_9]|nr:MAG: hypothetical protein A2Y60_04475 [Chloroflexi bacterium RBG_13_54_9]
MFVTHLGLTNFRNFSHLELDLTPGISAFQGGNAQGKTNLLEAIYLLATARSHRAETDRELINWSVAREESPFARLWAEVQKTSGKVKVEIGLQGQASIHQKEVAEDSQLYVNKRIRVNGVPRRAMDLVGQMLVVMFSSPDIELVGGAPTLRRRYLDVALSQIDPLYLRSLQSYNRVILQRNHLLRLIREGRAKSNQLAFWDEELVKTGSYIIVQRQHTVAALADLAASTHRRLTSKREALEIIYVGSIRKGVTDGSLEEGQLQAVAAAFQDELQVSQAREIERGMTLVGPHRDDLRLLANGIDMGVYASRGQQRTIALSLKLAEASLMQARTGDQPILLLDDVLSELDAERCYHLLESVTSYQQVLITTTLEPDSLEPLTQATRFKVQQGTVERL